MDYKAYASYQTMIDWERKANEELEARKHQKLCKFGLTLLDQYLRLSSNKLCLVIGRSEIGKTSFLAHMIKSQLIDGRKILMYSCEEFGTSFIQRLKNDFFHPIPTIFKKNFIMKDSSNIYVDEIREDFKILSSIGSTMTPEIIYIDQMNKILLKEGMEINKFDRITRVSEKLQGVLKEIKIPIVIAHQANRASTERKGYIQEEHIADADAVFREATMVLTVESPEYTEWNKRKDKMIKTFTYFINVAKNRDANGWKGAAPCMFDRSTGIFYEEREEEKYHLAFADWVAERRKQCQESISESTMEQAEA